MSLWVVGADGARLPHLPIPHSGIDLTETTGTALQRDRRMDRNLRSTR